MNSGSSSDQYKIYSSQLPHKFDDEGELSQCLPSISSLIPTFETTSTHSTIKLKNTQAGLSTLQIDSGNKSDYGDRVSSVNPSIIAHQNFNQPQPSPLSRFKGERCDGDLIVYQPSKPILDSLVLPRDVGPPSSNDDIYALNESFSSNSSSFSFPQCTLTNEQLNLRKRRRRRKFDEIARIYQCNWKTCTKAYGTLNHLNHHVTLQDHGPKRYAHEFRHLRNHIDRDQLSMLDAILQAASNMEESASNNNNNQ